MLTVIKKQFKIILCYLEMRNVYFVGFEMIYLNDDAKEYMKKYGWQHVVLDVEEITS